jgi:hypothetical protein
MASSAAPRPKEVNSTALASAGRVWRHRASAASERVRRPTRKVLAICRKTIPTIDSETSSVTPGIGALNKPRPPILATIRSMRRKIQIVPAAFIPSARA